MAKDRSEKWLGGKM